MSKLRKKFSAGKPGTAGSPLRGTVNHGGMPGLIATPESTYNMLFFQSFHFIFISNSEERSFS
jgi:hypothetical protein